MLYVATTPTGDPLERLAVQGLAFRGTARIEVVPEGMVLRVAGEQASFLPADRIVSAGEASYAIDRGVEPEGLVAVTWIANVADPEQARPARRQLPQGPVSGRLGAHHRRRQRHRRRADRAAAGTGERGLG